MQISLVIPAKNEAKRLPPSLNRIIEYFAAQPREWEVIVVDNGSRDETARLVEAAARAHPQVKLLREPRPGKGAALRTGMLAAQGEVVIFSDADLSCPIEEEAKLRQALQECEVAIASRRLAESVVDKSVRRRVMSALFNWMVQALALPGIKDSQCGFKAFRREAARRLFGAGQVDGWAFDVEILFLARKAGYRIAEIPVRWVQVGGSQVHALADSLRMMRDILRFRYHWARGAYRGRLESGK